MTKTLATRKQSEAIRARMQQIRSDLPYDVDAARQKVRQWTDWRYHVKQHPLPILGAAVAVGYWLVPAIPDRREFLVGTQHGERVSEERAAKRGVLSGMLGAVATMALRSGVSMAAQHLSRNLIAGNRASTNRMETLQSSPHSTIKSGVDNA